MLGTSFKTITGFLRKTHSRKILVVGRPKSAVERGNPALAVTGEKEFDAEEIKLGRRSGKGEGVLWRGVSW